MKRLFIYIATIAILISLGIQPAFAGGAQKEIKIFVDNLPVVFDVQPELKNNSTFVPFKPIAEAINVNVTWDGGERKVTAKDGKTVAVLQIGRLTAYVNGKPVTLTAAPYIKNGRTMVPARFFSETFGCNVSWDPAQYAVYVISPVREMTVLGYYALGDAKTSSWEDLFGKPYPEMGEGNTKLVSDLALGWYSLDKDYNLVTDSSTGWRRPQGWENLLEAAKKYSLKTEMVVHLTDSNSMVYNLISNPDAVAKVTDSIASEASVYGGANIDFEGLGWNDSGDKLAEVRSLFKKFIETLSGKLKAKGLRLTLSLHPQNSSYRGYDYEALGKLADRIVIMAYDYNLSPAPEPLDRVEEAVRTAVSVVPSEKLLLGISADSENERSIGTKVGIAKRYGLNGIAIWRLGLVSDEMWTELGKTEIARKG